MFLYIMCAFKNRIFPVWLFLRGKHYNQGLKSSTLVQTLASWFPSMLHCGGHINILMVTGPRNWPIYSDWGHALPTSDTNAGRVDFVPFSNIEATYIIQSCVADSQVFNTDKVSHKHIYIYIYTAVYIYTGHRRNPLNRAMTRDFDIFFDLTEQTVEQTTTASLILGAIALIMTSL